MSPGKVTERLNVNPTAVTVSDESQIQGARRGNSNLWLLDSENFVRSRDLRRHLDWIIAAIYPSRNALFELQAVPGIKMDVWCVWWSRYGDGGPALWPEQMLRLAELNLEISIASSFYGEKPEAE